MWGDEVAGMARVCNELNGRGSQMTESFESQGWAMEQDMRIILDAGEAV